MTNTVERKIMAEKQRRYRDRLKKDPEKWAMFKQKERERLARHRAMYGKRKENVLDGKYKSTAEERKKNAERQRKCRMKKKYLQQQVVDLDFNIEIFKTKPLFVNAVNRVRAALPHSIEKTKLIVRQLLKDYDPESYRILRNHELSARKTDRFEYSKLVDVYTDDVNFSMPEAEELSVGKNDAIKKEIDYSSNESN